MGCTIDEWLKQSVQADAVDKSLASLEPEEVIEKYFQALADRDEQVAVHCVSKKAHLGSSSTNMPFETLFDEFVSLPLTYFSPEFELNSYFDNLASIKLHSVKFIEEWDENTKLFGIDFDRQLNTEGIETGSCVCMVFESPQTGWKISYIGNY